MSLSDFWECSLWEFSAAVDGWNKAQGGDEDAPEVSDDAMQGYEKLLQDRGYR